MGRNRKPITAKKLVQKGDRFFAYLKHPTRNKTICFSLGTWGDVQKSLEALNRIHMNKELWANPPQDSTPTRIYEQWLGPDGILKLHGSGAVQRGETTLAATPEKVVAQQSMIEELKRQLETFQRKCEQQGAELEKLRGEEYQPGKCLTIGAARDAVLEAIAGKDPGHVKHVQCDLGRFCTKFGAATKCDAFKGGEVRINSWIQSLRKRDGKPLGPNARNYLQIYILKLLRAGGVKIDASKIDRVGKKEMNAKRQKIRWLTNSDASAVLAKLPQPYADAFHIQCRIGLRPFELLTLHRSNFTADFSELRLEQLTDVLTLKTGPRKNAIPIPSDLRPILEARARECEVLFPEPAGHNSKHPRKVLARVRKQRRPAAVGGQPWRDPDAFSRRFKNALVSAAKAANVTTPMDARVGRRTCASLLLQAGVPIVKVAELLGNSPEQIVNAYGDPSIKTMPMEATELKRAF